MHHLTGQLRPRQFKQLRQQLNTCPPRHLWRSLDPMTLDGSCELSNDANLLLASALEGLNTAVPDCTDTLKRFLGPKPDYLVPLLQYLPAHPQDGEAVFELRMSAVFWLALQTWYMASDVRLGHAPFINGLMAEGLLLWCEHQTSKHRALLTKSRAQRTEKDRSRISQLKADLRRAEQLAAQWQRLTDFKRCLEPHSLSIMQIYVDALLKQQIAPPEENKAAEPKADWTGPTHEVIVGELPPFKKHRDGFSKEEVVFWRRLLFPLPLRGGDQDPDELAGQLLQEFPWMGEAVELISSSMRFRQLSDRPPWFSFPPILLLGPPGTGKTRFARRLAELTQTGFRAFNVGGTSDNRDFQGTARGFSTTEPSAVLRTMVQNQSANPLIFIDEIEKAGGSERNGRIKETLLAMLEPESASHWYDESLCASCNLTQVNWILAANSLEGIPAPLLSRLTIINVGHPSGSAFEPVFQAILEDIAKDVEVPTLALPSLEKEAVTALSEAFANGASIRRVKAATRRALSVSMNQSFRPN